MPPFLDLRMSDSASSQIDALLNDKELGSVALLLMPIVGLERQRTVEIGLYTPKVLEEMVVEYASWGASLLQDCHGKVLAIFDDDMLHELSGKVLTYANGKYALAAHQDGT
ncbi:MAG: hypothetical protein EOO81_03650 [Oxalobacteraceae bacterium]|nr:MAG: hypothetical protein EOO81_03650 [Oxalobacteraceae bacterium]